MPSRSVFAVAGAGVALLVTERGTSVRLLAVHTFKVYFTLSTVDISWQNRRHNVQVGTDIILLGLVLLALSGDAREGMHTRTRNEDTPKTPWDKQE